MRNVTPEELALLVVPRGGNRFAPRPGAIGEDGLAVMTIVCCGVLSVALDEEAAAGESWPPHASWLVCRLRDGDGVEFWCRADFIFTTHLDAQDYLLTATPSQLAELTEQNLLEDI